MLSKRTLKIEVGNLSLKGEARYDRYKDIIQKEGKIGEVSGAEAATGEGAIVKIERDMRKIETMTRIEK